MIRSHPPSSGRPPSSARIARPLSQPMITRPFIPRMGAYGSVFVATNHISRFTTNNGKTALPSFNRFMNLLDLARESSTEAVTVYLEVQPKGAVDFTLTNFGILTVNVAELAPEQMSKIIDKATNYNIHLDLHAPWLSGVEGRGSAKEAAGRFSYPDPTNNPKIFANILKFAKMYKEKTGHKLELTFHTTGQPKDWTSWVRQVGKHAILHVENGFIYDETEQPEGSSYPADAFPYFETSRPYKQSEYLTWLRGLIREVKDNKVEINALVDIAHAASAENDPLAYVDFIFNALKITDVKRVHVASVNLEGTTLSQRDNHGVAPEFSRQATIALAKKSERYKELAHKIKYIFDYIEGLQRENQFGLTIESRNYFG